MALSRSSKIIIVLAMDTVFFLVELIVGYMIGSLALVADSFHMLNDVLSLSIALYAIKLSTRRTTNARLSYGWNRAEILAALINGVFLLALCFSIAVEAIQRFTAIHEISDPKLLVIVGTIGFFSNVIGLFLFHEHGHGDSPSQGRESPISLTPRLSGASERPAVITQASNIAPPITVVTGHREHHLSPSSLSRPKSYSSLYGYPPATRAMLIQTAQDIALSQTPSIAGSIASEREVGIPDIEIQRRESTAVVTTTVAQAESAKSSSTPRAVSKGHRHRHHNRSQGHASGSMNMRSLVLHVLGDGLGNVGVVGAGLMIWFAKGKFKYYFDPLISLVITAIIFSSALPLVRSAGFILLQATPTSVSVEDVEEGILAVDGVLSLHELHVWQLSESKLVASVHVTTSRTHDFMTVAVNIRKMLHDLGIHSSTIQPEYGLPAEPAELSEVSMTFFFAWRFLPHSLSSRPEMRSLATFMLSFVFGITVFLAVPDSTVAVAPVAEV